MIRPNVALLIPIILLTLGAPIYAAEPLESTQPKGRMLSGIGIVDSTCAMRVGNNDQAVTFQPATIVSVVRGQASFQQPLNIYISNCISSNALSSRTFKLTFEGESSGKDFNLQGAAKGIALQIKDLQGKSITPGMLLEDHSLSADTMALNYILELAGTERSLQSGDYYATIKLSVQHF